jgi:hypothetical protein
MTAQGVNINILDDQLGQVPPGQGPTQFVIGCSSGSTVSSSSTVGSFGVYTSNNPSAFSANSGYGPGPRLAAFMANLTGNPVGFVKVPSTTPGTVSAIYPTAGNGGTSVMTVTGTPNDDYYLVAKNLLAGTIGTGPVQLGISIDGGATYPWIVNMGTATNVTTGSAFTLYTGLTLSFTSAAQSLGDSYYGVCAAPLWSQASVQSAIQAAAAIKSIQFQDIMVAGLASASDVTAFDGYMTTLANTNKRFSRMLVTTNDITWGGASTQSEAAWLSALQTSYANSSSLRVGVCAGHYRFLDPFTQSQLRSSLIYGAASRDAGVAIQVDLGEVDMGNLQGLLLPPTPDAFGNGTFVYHDEQQTPGLDAARFLTAWQIVGLPGVYIMNPNLMAPPGSDFNWLQHGHVIDSACCIAYAYFIQKISSSVRVSATTGFILPQDRARLQAGCNAQLGNQLVTPNAVSSAVCVVSGTDNILSTATLTVSLQIVPLGYVKAVNVTISFLNPAVVAVQNQT